MLDKESLCFLGVLKSQKVVISFSYSDPSKLGQFVLTNVLVFSSSKLYILQNILQITNDHSWSVF